MKKGRIPRLLVGSILCSFGLGFQSPLPCPLSRRNDVSLYGSSNSNTVQEEEGLSEMDARVLRSMLQDSDKLDLQTEASLRKLLERGIVSKRVPRTSPPPASTEESDSPFSSQVLRTLADTKLWRTVSRKAEDWLESAKLYVQNRAERDAMALAALGLFAWERAVRDVGRALPAAAGTKETQKPLLLSQKSSFSDEMATPLDELRSVGTAVAEIWRTGGESAAGAANTGILRTAATSRRDGANFERAYRNRRRSVPRNPAEFAQNAAAGAADAAWQLEQELRAEANVPGYRTKQVRTALEAATDSTRRRLQSARETWRLEPANQRGEPPNAADSTNPVIDIPAEVVGTQQQQAELQRYLDTMNSHYQQEQEDNQRWNQLQGDLQAECLRLKDQLQHCIVNPEQTWLRSDVVQGAVRFDQSLIRKVVTEMIATRNSLKELIQKQQQSDGNWTVAQTMEELLAVRGHVEELRGFAEEAVSPGASRALEAILWDLAATEASQPVATRLEELQAQWEDLVERGTRRENAKRNPNPFHAAEKRESPEADDAVRATLDTTEAPKTKAKGYSAVEPEIVDVIREGFVHTAATTPLEATKAKPLVSESVAELVTDDAFEAAVGEVARQPTGGNKGGPEMAVASAEEPEVDDNAAMTLLLRVLDIVFFLLEKSFTVLFPALITSSATAMDRLDDVGRGGLGSEGWKRITNAKEGAKRY